jgi:hypothetical protein
MKMRRPPIPKGVEQEVLDLSARRCALCFGLDFDTLPKRGQLAHLDDDPTNNKTDNIAWLCPNHHDVSAARSPQSKRITIEEIKRYRDALYEYVGSRRKAAIEFVDTSVHADSGTGLRSFDVSRMLSKANIQSHLDEAREWASRIQFLGIFKSKSTEKEAVWLGIAQGARRYQSVNVADQTPTSALALLSGPESHLLLGDPGSGKTTTLKLITLAMLADKPTLERGSRYPVVVMLRALAEEVSLVNHICFTLGLEVESRDQFTKDGIRVTTYWLFGLPVEYGLPLFLESTNACLLVDGLDEVASQKKRKIVEDELENLRLRAPGAKIICTCRSGEYLRQMHGFHVSSILPLSVDDQKKLAAVWLGESTEFMDRLRSMPYADAGSRPLFLTQLIVLFARDGRLPERPAEVCERLLMLLLRDWDSERGIHRGSIYAQFDPSRKLDFLSSLSYQLTYSIKATQFTRIELERAYQAIHESFALPSEEAKEVVREIESHTGIIVEAQGGAFEFGHLSLQEFLCARYLVRDPFSRFLPEYLRQYPAPVAIAVSLSSNPSLWFAHCILDDRLEGQVTSQSVGVLLNRLRIECPTFAVCPELGLATIELLSRFAIDQSEVSDSVQEFAEQSTVLKSVGAAMGYFEWRYEHDVAIIEHRLDRIGPLHIRMPQNTRLSRALVLRALEAWGERVMQLDNGNFILEVV